jgi:hypothetical protein
MINRSPSLRRIASLPGSSNSRGIPDGLVATVPEEPDPSLGFHGASRHMPQHLVRSIASVVKRSLWPKFSGKHKPTYELAKSTPDQVFGAASRFGS